MYSLLRQQTRPAIQGVGECCLPGLEVRSGRDTAKLFGSAKLPHLGNVASRKRSSTSRKVPIINFTNSNARIIPSTTRHLHHNTPKRSQWRGHLLMPRASHQPDPTSRRNLPVHHPTSPRTRTQHLLLAREHPTHLIKSILDKRQPMRRLNKRSQGYEQLRRPQNGGTRLHLTRRYGSDEYGQTEHIELRL